MTLRAWTEEQIEAGARALYGDGWEKTATPGNKRYCREKVRAILDAVQHCVGESVKPENGT